MIIHFINPDAEGMTPFFGLNKERTDVLYENAIDILNNEIDSSTEYFNKNKAIASIISIAENEKEEAYLLFFAGQFIGELLAKIDLRDAFIAQIQK